MTQRWLLVRSSWRYGRRHPAQVLLCGFGIALGVAVVVAVDIALESSRRAFEETVATVRGAATHEIVSTGRGVPEELLRRIRVEAGVERAAPVIDESVRLEPRVPRGAAHGAVPLTAQLLGVDVYSEAAFREWRGGGGSAELPVAELITDRETMWLEAGAARELGIGVGDDVDVVAGGRRTELRLGAVFELSRTDGSGAPRLAVVDISTAQELFEGFGILSRIELVLAPEEVERVTSLLPAECALRSSETRAATLDRMTKAFQVNLRCLSLLALVVGWFLIYNSMAFSVVQRRGLFSRLRAWGLSESSLFRWIASEALLLGSVAIGAGLLLGVGLGHALVRIVATTISDLYFSLRVTEVEVSGWTLLEGVGLGLGTTALGAWLPAREAARSRPSGLRSRSERALRTRVPRLALMGLGVLAIALALLAVESRGLTIGYAVMLGVVVAHALCLPAGVLVLCRGLAVLVRPLGFLAVLAPRNVARHLSRTALAIAALSVAVSMSLGVEVMITSFRQSVVDWLETSIVADFYVSAPGAVASKGSEIALPDERVSTLRALPFVRASTTQRLLTVPTDLGPVRLAIRESPRDELLGIRLVDGEPARAWAAYRNGAVFASEPFANRHELGVGAELELRTSEGDVAFPIAGVFRDFASDEGYVVMDRSTYARSWTDPGVTGVALFLEEGVDPEAAQRDLDAFVQRDAAGLRIVSNAGIRQATLVVFDRTFAVTEVLRWLSILVAWVGVFSALLALLLERSREFAVLRARGLLPGQVTRLVISESAVMGLLSGVLAIPLGLALAWILTEVVHQRSFGWSLALRVQPGEIARALVLAVGAGVVAGIGPGSRLARGGVAERLRGRDE